jgi:hypothetical protein
VTSPEMADFPTDRAGAFLQFTDTWQCGVDGCGRWLCMKYSPAALVYSPRHHCHVPGCYIALCDHHARHSIVIPGRYNGEPVRVCEQHKQEYDAYRAARTAHRAALTAHRAALAAQPLVNAPAPMFVAPPTLAPQPDGVAVANGPALAPAPVAAGDGAADGGDGPDIVDVARERNAARIEALGHLTYEDFVAVHEKLFGPDGEFEHLRQIHLTTNLVSDSLAAGVQQQVRWPCGSDAYR